MQVAVPATYATYTVEHVLRELVLYKGSQENGFERRQGKLETRQLSMFDDFTLNFLCTAAARGWSVAKTTNEGLANRR